MTPRQTLERIASMDLRFASAADMKQIAVSALDHHESCHFGRDAECDCPTLESVAAEFIRYWTTDRTPDGCGMCGGIPHSTTCHVGRMATLVGSAPVLAGEAGTDTAQEREVYSDYWKCEACGLVMHSPTTGLMFGPCFQCNNTPLIIGEQTPTKWLPITARQAGCASVPVSEASASLPSAAKESSSSNSDPSPSSETVAQAKERLAAAIDTVTASITMPGELEEVESATDALITAALSQGRASQEEK